VAAANPERKRNAFDKMKESVGAPSNDTFSKLATMPVVTYFYEIVMQRIQAMEGMSKWCGSTKQACNKGKKLWNMAMGLIVESNRDFVEQSFVARPSYSDGDVYDAWVKKVKEVTTKMEKSVYEHITSVEASWQLELEKSVYHKNGGIGEFVPSAELKEKESLKRRRITKPAKATVSALSTIALRLKNLRKINF
jgi:hypothetical protein